MRCYRAPTKVILVGEHFVVRGVPGVAAAVGLWSYACAEASEPPGFIEAPDLGASCRVGSCRGLEGLEEIVRAVGPVRLRVWSEAPPGAGLGSSGSVSAAAAAAVLAARGRRVDHEEVERLAWLAERVHHGRPSGIDHTTAIVGGFVVFEARGVYWRLEAPRLRLVVGDTGVPRSTRVAVERVLSRYARHRGGMGLVYAAAARLVEEAVDALRRRDLATLGELMDVFHGLLYALGVSTPEIERLVWTARRAGALGAKLTGAGLGGIVVALVEDEETGERVAEAMRGAGARWARVVEAGVEGLSEARVIA